jgi:Pentapeptide repeats (8 copies)
VNLSAEDAQRWVTIIGTLATVLVTVLTFFRSQNRRDVRAAVGASFASTVEALASENDTTRMAGAVLLRRFFDRQTEQGTRGTPYVKEAIELIAGMLREELPPRIQKVLADGLRYAADLQRADLQHCNLQNAYLGWKSDDDRGVNLTEADLYESNCSRASFKKACLHKTVFFRADLTKASMIDADCTEADLREANLAGANLTGANLAGAQIGGADFAGARDIPPEVAELLDAAQKGLEGAVVPQLEQHRTWRLRAMRR